MITLKKSMRSLDPNESYTIGTEYGRGWLYYFDGEKLVAGTDIPLEQLLDREVIEVYERTERKYWSENERKYANYIELEKGLAFIVGGSENGTI